MQIDALIGPSGAGKSHHAAELVYNYDIIIDDGLLIQHNRILTGYSAKNEENKMAAVRRAIFSDDMHAQQARNALQTVQPQTILILGTSTKMIDRIIEVLGLPSQYRIIPIEEISTAAQIRLAHEIRDKEGKHVIPLPSIEIKPHLRAYFLDQMANIFKKKSDTTREIGDRCIVRPNFSFYGKLKIHETAIENIAEHVIQEFDIVKKSECKATRDEEQRLVIHVDLNILFGKPFPPVVKQLQRRIKEEVECWTGLNVHHVHAQVKKLTMPGEEK